MTASEMICHLSDQLRIALGEIPAKLIEGPLNYPLFKQLVIYVLPWPKGKTKSPPEAKLSAPASWQGDLDELKNLVERFGSEDEKKEWPDHPVFGRMNGKLWGALSYKHFDHHLRQFGL